MNKSRGFTLIELLIVFAIVGIIAAIAIPNLKAAIDRGKDVEQNGTLEERWVAQCVANTSERDGGYDVGKVQKECQLIWDMGVEADTPIIVPSIKEEDNG